MYNRSIILYYVDIIGRNFMRNICDVAYISCEVVMLSFQAHANYKPWAIDFGF